MDQKEILKPQNLDFQESEQKLIEETTKNHFGLQTIDDKAKYLQEFIKGHQQLCSSSQDSDKAQLSIENLLLKINQEALIKLSNHEFTVQQQAEKQFIQFDVQIVRHMTTFQIVEVYCKWGRFGKKFIILNTDEKSHIHSSMPLEKGAFATIYQVNLFNKVSTKFAVKCLPLKKIQDKHKHFYQILKELFLTHMMSALQIGPLIQKINGFDLVIYQKCMEFSMEKCQTLQQVTFTLEMEKDLKKSLLAMHSLNICHIDIKPMNIMFSPHRKKAVFIDFGFSKILKQSIGQKTQTKFQGTYEYCSEQMRKLFKRGQQYKQFIHLYMNDLYGLTCSIQNLKKKQAEGQQFNIQKNLKQANKEKKKITNSQIFRNETLTSTYQSALLNFKFNYQILKYQSEFTIDKKIDFINSHQEQLFVNNFKFLIYVYNSIFYANYFGTMINDSQFVETIYQIVNNSFFKDLNIFVKTLCGHAIYNGYQIYDLTANDPKSLIFQKKYYFYKQIQKSHEIRIKKKSITLSSVIQLSKQQRINILKDREKVQIQFLNKQSIIKYFNWIIQLTTFTQNIKEMTSQIRKEIFMVFSSFRQNIKQILTTLNYPSKNIFDFVEFNIQQLKPLNFMIQSQAIIFYSYALSIVLRDIKLNIQQNQLFIIQQIENKKQSYQQNLELSQFEISFQQMFLMLKNSILLQFNYYLYLKIYLKKCIQKILKSEQYRKNFMLIVSKQLIEIGSLIHSTYFQIKQKQQKPFLRTQFLNEQLLIFDMDIEFIVKKQQKQKIKQNLKTIQNMWVFFNQDLGTFNRKYEELIPFLLQIQNNLKNQFKQLNGNQKNKFYVSYLYLLSILRDYSVTKGLGVKSPFNRNSTSVFDAQKNYQTLINRVNGQEIQQQRTYQESLISQKLNYFNLTNPFMLYYSGSLILSDKIRNIQLAKRIIYQMTNIIKDPLISGHMFLGIKIQVYIVTTQNRRFQEIKSLFCSDEISFFHNLQFYNKMLELCIRSIQTGPINEQCFKYLRILWNSGIKIINLLKLQVSSERKSKFKGQDYISLIYTQIIQNLIFIFTIPFKRIINKQKNINLKIQNWLQIKSMIEEIKYTINDFQEKAKGNLHIQIFNLSVQIKTNRILRKIKKLWGYQLPNPYENFSANYEHNINYQEIVMIVHLAKVLEALKTNEIKSSQNKKHNELYWALLIRKIITQITSFPNVQASFHQNWNLLTVKNKIDKNLNLFTQILIIRQIAQQAGRFGNQNKKRQFLTRILNFFEFFKEDNNYQSLYSSLEVYFTINIETFRTFIINIKKEQATKVSQALEVLFENFKVYQKGYIYFLLRQETRQILQYQVLKQWKVLRRMLQITALRNDKQLMEQLYLIIYERKIGTGKERKKRLSSLRELMKKVTISSFFRRSIIKKKMEDFLSLLFSQQNYKSTKQKRVNQTLKLKKYKYLFVVLQQKAINEDISNLKSNRIEDRVRDIMKEMKDDKYKKIQLKKRRRMQLMEQKTEQKMKQKIQFKKVKKTIKNYQLSIQQHLKLIQEARSDDSIKGREKDVYVFQQILKVFMKIVEQLTQLFDSPKYKQQQRRRMQLELKQLQQIFQDYIKSNYQPL